MSYIWEITVRFAAHSFRFGKLIDEIGVDGSVAEKLSEIASGRWNPQSYPRAGSTSLRKRLKVPVWKTLCGKNQFILWQIFLGIDAETEAPQQEITGEL